MKTINADKFIARINQIKYEIKPTESALKENDLLNIYWKAIDISLSSVITAVIDSTQETPD